MFTRKSTGLVRQGKWLDSFVFDSSASFFFGPLVFALSSLVFLGGDDLISAEGIALIFAISIAAMYAVLTAMMPRSGGDYVFNSRILHPAIGFSFNFSLTVWQLFSAAFTLFFIFYVALSPALEVLSIYTGDNSLFRLGTFLGNPVNAFLLATLVNVLFTSITILGIRKIFWTLNLLWGVTILGTLAMVISLFSTSTESFASNFNNFMVSANGTSTSQDAFASIISEGASVAPSFHLVIPAIAICASSVIWVFYESYVSGEIRGASRVKRNLSTMIGAACFNGGLFALLIYLLYEKVGATFLTSITYLSGTAALPAFSAGPLQALTAVLILAVGNPYSAILVVAAITLGYTILLLPPLYLQPIRSIFAWSFDRVLPSAFSDVSSRYKTPLYATLAVFGIIEASLVVIAVEYGSLLGIFFAVIIAPAFSCIFPTSFSAIVLGVGRRARFNCGFKPQVFRILLILGIVSLCFILFMTYVYVSNESFFFPTSAILSPSLLIGLNFVIIPVGALIYFVSYSYRKTSNQLNLNSIASEIPPE